MAIVSQKALNDLIEEYNLAASGKYNVEFSKTTAVKALLAAITMLEQIDQITKDATITIHNAKDDSTPKF